MLEALNGFLIFVNKKLKVQFVSKTVEDHLGLKQVSEIYRHSSETYCINLVEHPGGFAFTKGHIA